MSFHDSDVCTWLQSDSNYDGNGRRTVPPISNSSPKVRIGTGNII